MSCQLDQASADDSLTFINSVVLKASLTTFLTSVVLKASEIVGLKSSEVRRIAKKGIEKLSSNVEVDILLGKMSIEDNRQSARMY
jgi:hypothetical protein